MKDEIGEKREVIKDQREVRRETREQLGSSDSKIYLIDGKRTKKKAGETRLKEKREQKERIE